MNSYVSICIDWVDEGDVVGSHKILSPEITDDMSAMAQLGFANGHAVRAAVAGGMSASGCGVEWWMAFLGILESDRELGGKWIQVLRNDIQAWWKDKNEERSFEDFMLERITK